MEPKTYTVEEIQTLLANLDNPTCKPSVSAMNRTRLPIPSEFGGGYVTGYSVEDAVRRLSKRLNIRPKPSAPYFSECFDAWMNIKRGQERSETTLAVYEYAGASHLKPFFGNMRMDEITPDHIQLFYNSLMPLSKSVSNKCKAILNGVFERSERLGDISRNPMRFKYEKSNKVGQKVVLQDDDLVRVIGQLDSLKSDEDIRDYLYFCFLCFTALRRGEILGLRWGDIDFEKNEITVQNNITYPNGVNNGIAGPPKDDSFGTVHLNSLLRERLLPYKGNITAYVLPYSSERSSEPMTRSMFTKMWNRCKNKIDLKGATSHSFRASYASMMNAHCDHIDPKALQGALRHKTPDLAIKVYTKKNDNKTRQAEIEYDAYLCNVLNS